MHTQMSLVPGSWCYSAWFLRQVCSYMNRPEMGEGKSPIIIPFIDQGSDLVGLDDQRGLLQHKYFYDSIAKDFARGH